MCCSLMGRVIVLYSHWLMLATVSIKVAQQKKIDYFYFGGRFCSSILNAICRINLVKVQKMLIDSEQYPQYPCVILEVINLKTRNYSYLYDFFIFFFTVFALQVLWKYTFNKRHYIFFLFSFSNI